MENARLPFNPLRFGEVRLDVERRANGELVLRSGVPLAPYARGNGEWLEHWARHAPDRVFIAERQGEGWRELTYAEALRAARAIGSALVQRGLSSSRPVAILSDNSVDHAMIKLGCHYVGVPVAPISQAYSLMSKDHAKLKAIFKLLEPGLVYVGDEARFAASLAALAGFKFELVSSQPAPGSKATPFSALLGTAPSAAAEHAYAHITGDTIAKFLFTSGSTGEPKSVINTQRMITSNQVSYAGAWPFLTDEPPVIVDWLPWNHTFGGNSNFNMVLANGGSYYLDDGKPAPGLVERTAANLKLVAPTIYLSVPRGYDMLLPFLENDAQLRRNFFSRLKLIFYAGASLPPSLWARLEQLGIDETGQRVRMISSWGSTETAPMASIVNYDIDRAGVIGNPAPGCELKLLPVGESNGKTKYEIRVRGPNVTPGYWKREDLTRAAFDEEGFYKMGDAVRFADPADFAKGIEFDGRVSEEFKLTSGTWVHTGALRVKAIAALAPVAQDIVITGHDRTDIGFLIFPNLPACRKLAADLPADAPLSQVLAHPAVRACAQQGMRLLKTDGGGSSTYAARALFLEEPPNIDAGEITDKGYINQRAVLARRAAQVATLYTGAKSATVMEV